MRKRQLAQLEAAHRPRQSVLQRQRELQSPLGRMCRDGQLQGKLVGCGPINIWYAIRPSQWLGFFAMQLPVKVRRAIGTPRSKRRDQPLLPRRHIRRNPLPPNDRVEQLGIGCLIEPETLQYVDEMCARRSRPHICLGNDLRPLIRLDSASTILGVMLSQGSLQIRVNVDRRQPWQHVDHVFDTTSKTLTPQGFSRREGQTQATTGAYEAALGGRREVAHRSEGSSSRGGAGQDQRRGRIDGELVERPEESGGKLESRDTLIHPCRWILANEPRGQHRIAHRRRPVRSLDPFHCRDAPPEHRAPPGSGESTVL